MSDERICMEVSLVAMLEAARGSIKSLNPERAAKAVTGSAILIDLREEDERRAHGWIADSVWVPRGMLEFWADPASPDHRREFDRSRPFVLYCASGERSALAADTLARMGYREVFHLEGGLKAWKDSGRPVERP